MPKRSTFQRFLNSRVIVTVLDGRVFSGRLLSADSHQNLVLADTELSVIRSSKKRKLSKQAAGASGNAAAPSTREERQTLGLVVLRGANVVSMRADDSPIATATAASRFADVPLVDPTAVSSRTGLNAGLAGPVAMTTALAPPALRASVKTTRPMGGPPPAGAVRISLPTDSLPGAPSSSAAPPAATRAPRAGGAIRIMIPGLAPRVRPGAGN